MNPLTAILTIAAIFFAGIQVREATRQSDAAVRENLVAVRMEVLNELERIKVINAWVFSTAFTQMAVAHPQQASLPSRFAIDEIFEGLAICRELFPPNASRLSSAPHNVMVDYDLVTQLGSMLFDLMQFFQKLGRPFDLRWVIPLDEWGRLKEYVLKLSTAINSYKNALEHEVFSVNSVISVIDSRILSEARNRYGSKFARGEEEMQKIKREHDEFELKAAQIRFALFQFHTENYGRPGDKRQLSPEDIGMLILPPGDEDIKMW